MKKFLVPVSRSHYTFLSLRALGDAVICVSHLMKLPLELKKNLQFIVGAHAEELVTQLAPDFPVRFLGKKVNEPLPFYYLRSKNPAAVFKSYLYLRRELGRCKSKTTFVFDQITLREWMLTYPKPRIGIINSLNSNNKNRYVAYQEFLKSEFELSPVYLTPSGSGKTVLIFPHGRYSFRDIPVPILNKVVEIIQSLGLNPLVYTLKGSRDLVGTTLDYSPRDPSFKLLSMAISSCKAVISADSLPVHLSAHFNRPVYVLTPYKETLNWLPIQSLTKNYWSLYTERQAIGMKIHRFLRDAFDQVDAS